MAPTSLPPRAPPSLWERATTIVARQTGNGVSTADCWGCDTSTPEGAHLAAIIVPSILGAILLAGGGYYTYRHFIRKRRTTKDYFERIRNGLFYTVMLTIGLPFLLGYMAFGGIKGWRERRRGRIAFDKAGTNTNANTSANTSANTNASTGNVVSTRPSNVLPPQTIPPTNFAVAAVEMANINDNPWADTPGASSYNTTRSIDNQAAGEARVQTPPPSYGYEKASAGDM